MSRVGHFLVVYDMDTDEFIGEARLYARHLKSYCSTYNQSLPIIRDRHDGWIKILKFDANRLFIETPEGHFRYQMCIEWHRRIA